MSWRDILLNRPTRSPKGSSAYYADCALGVEKPQPRPEEVEADESLINNKGCSESLLSTYYGGVSQPNVTVSDISTLAHITHNTQNSGNLGSPDPMATQADHMAAVTREVLESGAIPIWPEPWDQVLECESCGLVPWASSGKVLVCPWCTVRGGAYGAAPRKVFYREFWAKWKDAHG